MVDVIVRLRRVNGAAAVDTFNITITQVKLILTPTKLTRRCSISKEKVE